MEYELNKHNLLAFLKTLEPEIVGLVSKLRLPFEYEGVELSKHHTDLQKDYENGSWDFRFRVPLAYFKQGKEDKARIERPVLFIVNTPNVTPANENGDQSRWIDSLDRRGNIDANALPEKSTVALRALRWIYEVLKKARDEVSPYDVDKFINFAAK